MNWVGCQSSIDDSAETDHPTQFPPQAIRKLPESVQNIDSDSSCHHRHHHPHLFHFIMLMLRSERIALRFDKGVPLGEEGDCCSRPPKKSIVNK